MRALLAASILLSAIGCSGSSLPGPCVGQPPQCQQAVSLAKGHLGSYGVHPAEVTSVAIEPIGACAQVIRASEHLCPRDLEYAARVRLTVEGWSTPVIVHVDDWSYTDMAVAGVDNVPKPET